MYDHLVLTEKKPVWLCCQFGSGQTLQQTPRIPGSAEIMRNRSTEPMVAYLSLRYLNMPIQAAFFCEITIANITFERFLLTLIHHSSTKVWCKSNLLQSHQIMEWNLEAKWLASIPLACFDWLPEKDHTTYGRRNENFSWSEPKPWIRIYIYYPEVNNPLLRIFVKYQFIGKIYLFCPIFPCFKEIIICPFA